MSRQSVTAVDVTGKTQQVPVDQLRWRPSAYGIILRDGKVLLSKQFEGYDLPGGGINLGETPEEAVIREIKEETGIDAANPVLLTVANSFFIQTYKKHQPVQTLHIYYQCEMIGGELSKDGFDEYEKEYADMPEWLPISKLDDIKVENSYDWRPLIKQLAGV